MAVGTLLDMDGDRQRTAPTVGAFDIALLCRIAFGVDVILHASIRPVISTGVNYTAVGGGSSDEALFSFS